MEKIVGQLKENEATEIRHLYEKKLALENLLKIIDPANQELYDKVMGDYTTVFNSFQNWWKDMRGKYTWECAPDGNWKINFDTNDVILVY